MPNPSTYTTPAQLLTELKNRTGTTRAVAAGGASRWSDTDFYDAISQAIAMAQPLGRKRMFQMTGANYLVNNQPMLGFPTNYLPEVISIEKVMIKSATGQPSHVPTDLYWLDRYNNVQWLWLFNPPAAADTIQIYCVECIDPAISITVPNQTIPLPLDAEMLLAYAMAELYRTYVDYGQSSAREQEEVWSTEWHQIGDMRRQQYLAIQYPQTVPATAPAAHPASGSHHK